MDRRSSCRALIRPFSKSCVSSSWKEEWRLAYRLLMFSDNVGNLDLHSIETVFQSVLCHHGTFSAKETSTQGWITQCWLGGPIFEEFTLCSRVGADWGDSAGAPAAPVKKMVHYLKRNSYMIDIFSFKVEYFTNGTLWKWLGALTAPFLFWVSSEWWPRLRALASLRTGRSSKKHGWKNWEGSSCGALQLITYFAKMLCYQSRSRTAKNFQF